MTKKRRGWDKTCKLDIYKKEVVLLVEPDDSIAADIVSAHTKRRYRAEDLEDENASTFKLESGCAIVRLRKKNSIDSLMHECIHAANHVLYTAGVEVTETNDEALTYLAAYIFKNFRQ